MDYARGKSRAGITHFSDYKINHEVAENYTPSIRRREALRVPRARFGRTPPSGRAIDYKFIFAAVAVGLVMIYVSRR